MINSRKDVKRYIEADIKPFKYHSIKLKFWAFITKDFNYFRIRFCIHLRKLEYYSLHPKLFFLFKWYHKYQKNRIGRMYNWEIPSWTCEEGIHLWHPNVVINDDAKVGKNALFHGNNCLGRKNDTKEGNLSPVIGDNFNLGFGSVVIGGVKIGNDVCVGANSTVIKDVEEKCVVVGSPAKVIKRLQ